MSGSFFVVGYIVYHCPPSTLLMEGTGIYLNLLYPLQRSCRGVYWFHHVRPSVRL